MAAPLDLTAELSAHDVSYDPRSRRLTAILALGANAQERRLSLRVTGTLVEMMDVPVLTRSINRGETVQAADILIERRVKETVPNDLHNDPAPLAGRIARRALSAGHVVRTGDLAKPELVARGETITILYEVPGLSLTLRGKASESGALGDMITVLNPQSKKTLQATVIAAGKVTVSPVQVPRLVANARP
jgi:flagellar basal body P-ring formation protein FlgA